MTTEALLKRLDDLEAKATKGPWVATDPDLEQGDVRVCTLVDGECVCCVALMGKVGDDGTTWTDETRQRWLADQHLITTLRNAYPDLARRLRVAEEALERISKLDAGNEVWGAIARSALAEIEKGGGDE